MPLKVHITLLLGFGILLIGNIYGGDANLLMSLVGTIVFIYGCMLYVEEKGYGKVYGLLGLLNIFGLIILAVLPNKNKIKAEAVEEHIASEQQPPSPETSSANKEMRPQTRRSTRPNDPRASPIGQFPKHQSVAAFRSTRRRRPRPRKPRLPEAQKV